MKITLTPELAKELLKKNVKNRKLNKRHVDSLANDMRDGNWTYTGDAIKVSEDDVLTDGQHRLEAVVKSGCNVVTELITGVMNESFQYTDTGLPRGARQVLEMEGISNSTSVASIAKGLLMIESQGGVTSKFVFNSNKRTNREILEKSLDIIEHLEDSKIIQKCNQEKIVAPVRVALMYIYLNSDKQIAKKFINHLTDGLFSDKNDPCKRLRDRLSENTGKSGSSICQVYMALTFKAWNSYITSSDCKVLRYSLAERFPVPKVLE